MKPESTRKLGEIVKGMRAPLPVSEAAPAKDDPVCPSCNGAGWLRNDVPFGHPLFGRPIACDCLLSQREERDFEELLAVSNLEPFRHQTFANFDPKIPGLDAAFQAAKDFARDPSGWLVIRGRIGTGKTHLAAAIANATIARRCRTLFVVVPELLDHLRSAFSPTSEISYDELFERVRTVFLLVLDDLGTESGTPWAQEKLFQIFNHRYNMKLPTVITTNRPLNRIDDRIVSRMTDRVLCEVIDINAESYRERAAGQRRFRDRR